MLTHVDDCNNSLLRHTCVYARMAYITYKRIGMGMPKARVKHYRGVAQKEPPKGSVRSDGHKLMAIGLAIVTSDRAGTELKSLIQQIPWSRLSDLSKPLDEGFDERESHKAAGWCSDQRKSPEPHPPNAKAASQQKQNPFFEPFTSLAVNGECRVILDNPRFS